MSREGDLFGGGTPEKVKGGEEKKKIKAKRVGE